MESETHMETVARRNRSGGRIRRFVFTLNNWTQAEYDSITALPCSWMVIGKEVGDSGTPHLQGACILGTQMSFSRLKTLTGFKRCHIEPMYGSPEKSLAYCSKEDLHPYVSGILPIPGKRSDIHLAVEKIMEGSTLRELASDDTIGAISIVKYHKGLTILRGLSVPERDPGIPPLVFWLHGETGVGKTRCAFEFGQHMGGGPDGVWISSGGLRWFDGYDGQPVAILDDFRAKHLVGGTGFSFLLRLLDVYPLRVEFKGGFVNWAPHCIIITSSRAPDECFAWDGRSPEDIRQLTRRLTSVIECTSANCDGK